MKASLIRELQHWVYPVVTTDSWHWFHVPTMTTFQHDSWQHDMRPTACTRWSEPRGKFCNNGDTCILTYLMAMLGLWRLVRRLVVTACAVLWVWVTALLTVWGVEVEGWTGAAQYSCYLTQALARPLSCTQVSWSPGHTALQRNLRQCSTALYSVLLCIRHCDYYQWSIHIYNDHPLNWHYMCPCYQVILSGNWRRKQSRAPF